MSEKNIDNFYVNFIEANATFRLWRTDKNDPLRDADSFNLQQHEAMVLFESMLDTEIFRERAKDKLISLGLVRLNHN